MGSILVSPSSDTRTLRVTQTFLMARNKDKRAPAQPVEVSVLRWSHPQVSALVLLSGLVFFISLLKFSLVSVLAHFALAMLMLGVGSRVYVHLMGFLKKPCSDPLDLVRDIEVTLPTETLKFAILLYIITFIGAVFNTLSLLILAWLGAFLFPTIYDQNKDQFDDMADKFMEKYRGIDAKIHSLLPAPKQEAPAPVMEKEE